MWRIYLGIHCGQMWMKLFFFVQVVSPNRLIEDILQFVEFRRKYLRLFGQVSKVSSASSLYPTLQLRLNQTIVRGSAFPLLSFCSLRFHCYIGRSNVKSRRLLWTLCVQLWFITRCVWYVLVCMGRQVGRFFFLYLIRIYRSKIVDIADDHLYVLNINS